MRRLFFTLCFVAGFAGAQSFSVVYDATNAQLDTLQLVPLADGGVLFNACARVGAADGGAGPAVRDCVDGRLQSAANINHANILLATALGRWKMGQGFQADAGAQ